VPLNNWRMKILASATNQPEVAADVDDSNWQAPPMGMCVKLSVFPLYDRFFWNHTAQNEGVFIIH
jgi:hypothetical protein